MITEKDIELLELYLQEALTSEETMEVEERLSSDPQFADNLKLIQEIPLAINSTVDQFRDKWQEIVAEEHVSPSSSAKVRSMRPWYLLAAAMLMGVVSGIFLLNQSSSTDLYAAHFSVPPENISVRSDEGQSQLQSAIDAYNAKEYQTAAEAFESYLDTHSDDIGAQFYQGISYLASDDHERGQHVLKQIVDVESSYQGASRFYLALSYLKMEDSEKSRELLQLVIASSSSYKSEAQSILSQIK